MVEQSLKSYIFDDDDAERIARKVIDRMLHKLGVEPCRTITEGRKALLRFALTNDEFNFLLKSSMEEIAREHEYSEYSSSEVSGSSNPSMFIVPKNGVLKLGTVEKEKELLKRTGSARLPKHNLNRSLTVKYKSQ